MIKQVLLFKLLAATGYILNTIGESEKVGLYSNKLRNTGNQFMKQLKRSEDIICKQINSKAGIQLDESYTMFNNLIELNLMIDEKKKKSFNRELAQLVGKYKKV
jgi:hypothetical protein